jgi:hypothetical protein
MYNDSVRNLSPKAAMEALGIREDLQAAILDPYSKDIFETRDLHTWLRDTTGTNYLLMLDLHERLQLTAQAMQDGKTTSPIAAALQSKQAGSSPYRSQPYTIVPSLPPTKPDSITFYKAWSPHDFESRFATLFNECEDDEGYGTGEMQINLVRIHTPGSLALGYEWHCTVELTTQREYAER